jgi:hypothetical protein
MGYYIPGLQNKNKADQIISKWPDAILLGSAPSWDAVPSDKAIICVVDNGPFEAAGYAFSERELAVFNHHGGRSINDDRRPRKWLLMDKPTVEKITGYAEDHR